MTEPVEVLRRPESAEPPPPELPVMVIEPRSGWRVVDLGELWRYRELVMFLTWRDIKVRYKQTVLGAAWAVLQPLATMVVFTLFLGRVTGSTAEGAPAYPLFVFAGLLPWLLFANSISSVGLSVVGNQSLVTKVYFPRLIIPISSVGVGVIDFGIALAVLGVMMACYGVAPGWAVLLAPVIVLALVVAALGVGTLLSALTVAYRDFRYVVPFGVQLWMFATPSIYLQAGWEPGSWGYLLLPLNPAYGLIAAFRQAVLGGPIDLYTLGVSSAVAAALFVVGCLYFRRVERSFADII
jgi:lipopolysaccharide transport system permease protein